MVLRLIVQPTQSGKTGVMFGLCKLFIENPLYMIIQQTYILLVDWNQQSGKIKQWKGIKIVQFSATPDGCYYDCLPLLSFQ